jgi:hypothetical protein
MRIIRTLAIVCVAMTGCASWQDAGRRTIEVSAVVVDGADQALAQEVTRVCLPGVHDLPVGDARNTAVDACVTAHFAHAQAGIRSADASLRSGEAIIDAGNESVWTATLPCLAKAAVEALDAVASAGITLPTTLAEPRRLTESYAAQCHATPTTQGAP